MANSNNSFKYPVLRPDLLSSSTYIQQPLPINNNYNPQPSFNQNYMQQPIPNLEDITDPIAAINTALALMAKTFKLNYSTPTNNNQRISSNLQNRQIAQPGNQVVQNAVQNSGVHNVGNQNGVIIVPGIAHQNGNGNVVAARAEGNTNGNNGNQIRCYNCRGLGHLARNCTVRPRRKDVAYLQTQLLIAQKEEAGIQLQAEEFDLMADAADLDEIEEVNANCILMANLQQASTSGTQSDNAPVYDTDGSAEVQLHENCYNNEIFNMFTQEEQYTELLEPIPEPHQVPQNDSNVISEVSSVEQGGGTVEQHSANVEETRAYHESLFHNLAAEVEKVNSVNRKMKEKNAELTTELARYKNQERCFEISQEKYDKLERCYQQSVYQEQCLSKKINALYLSSGKQITALNEEISNLNKQLSKEKSTVSSLQEEKKRLKSDFKIREDELLDKQIQLENKVKELDNILIKMGQSIQTMHTLLPKPNLFYHTKQKMALGYQNLFYLKQAQQKQQSLCNGKVLLEKHDPPTVYDSEETLKLAQESRLKMQLLNKEIKPSNYTKINHLLGVFVSQTAKSREEFYLSNTFNTANVSKSISIPNEEFSDDTTLKAAKFVRDFQSLANEADESLAKHKALELEIERLLRAVENEYAKLWNDWYKKCEECKYDKISYDKAYNDMQQKIERLQAQLGDQKGKSKDTPCVSDTLDPLFQKLENENVSEQKDTTRGTSANTKFAKQSILGILHSSSRPKLYAVTPLPKSTAIPKVGETNALSNQVTSNSVPSSQDIKVVEKDNVIAPGMFRIDPRNTSRENKFVPIHNVKASVWTNPITMSQPHVIFKKVVNSDSNGFSSTGVDVTTKTRRPQPRSNTKNYRVPSASQSSCIKNKEVEVEEHHRKLLLSKNLKPMSSECNNIKLAIRNDKSEVVCAMCKKCLITTNHDVCVLNYVNGMKPHGTVRFGNDHVAAILGFGDLQWGNILITRVYFVEGLGHNLFLVGQFCDSDLEVAFRRNTCFIRNLEGVDLLKGNCTTNLYTINLHGIASASPIFLMARATSTKSWLWHQRLSHLNFDTINDLARNDLVIGLPKFKYHKEHLCPSYLCGPMRIASINGKRYVLAPVIIVRTDNDIEFKNQVLQEYFKSVGISHQASSVHTPQQNGVVE
ncbi:retrovirus-related pol polyprotein from transposon TNT 1-94 [Tanacetum coccineum]